MLFECQWGCFCKDKDAIVKDDLNGRVEKVVETYAEKVKVSAAGVKTADVSRAGVSASTTLASKTAWATFQQVVEAFFQTKTDLKQLHVRQDEIIRPMIEVTSKNLPKSMSTMDCHPRKWTRSIRMVELLVTYIQPGRLRQWCDSQDEGCYNLCYPRKLSGF